MGDRFDIVTELAEVEALFHLEPLVDVTDPFIVIMTRLVVLEKKSHSV